MAVMLTVLNDGTVRVGSPAYTEFDGKRVMPGKS